MANPSEKQLKDKLNESIMLIMFAIPKKSKSEKIPPGIIPADRIKYVLTELGFTFLATIEYDEIEKDLIGSKSEIS